MKYLKYYKILPAKDNLCWDKADGLLYKYGQKIISQPKSGPTTFVLESSDNKNITVVYAGKEILMGDECPIKYTWKFEYYQGYPAITLNFSKNDFYNSGVTLFICIECKNMNREFIDQHKMVNNFDSIISNRSLGVYSDHLFIHDVEDLTYIYLDKIETNKDYHLFITVTDRYKQNWSGGSATKYAGLKYPDWKCKLWLRPSVRCSKFGLYNEHSDTGSDTRYYKIPAEDYRYFEFNYYDVLNVVNENN